MLDRAKALINLGDLEVDASEGARKSRGSGRIATLERCFMVKARETWRGANVRVEGYQSDEGHSCAVGLLRRRAARAS
jgi:hypothetical protein